MKQYFITSIIIASISFLSLKCKDVGVQPTDKTFTLTVEDVSCTEVWLKLSVVNIAHPAITLKRDGITVDTIYLARADTAIVDENLLPSHTYTYTASLLNGSLASSSTARTMDTTSHNFNWQTFTLGDGTGSSVLNDVAIINDTLAYACGAIYSGGSVYNLARWNGQAWQLQQIQFYTICGQQSRTPYSASSIFAFSKNDIWIAMDGDQVARWDGNAQTATICLPVSFSVKKLWGENPNSVYAVGYDGTNGIILHYNGSSWQKIESGTNTPIQDIWGAIDSKTGKRNILCGVSAGYNISGAQILSINENNTVSVVPWVSERRPFSVWFKDIFNIYTCGDGVFRRCPDLQWQEIAGASIIPAVTRKLRGQANNDIFVVGDYCYIAHYNGKDFHLFPEITTSISLYELRSCDFKNNMMIAVGGPGKAVIVRMWR